MPPSLTRYRPPTSSLTWNNITRESPGTAGQGVSTPFSSGNKYATCLGPTMTSSVCPYRTTPWSCSGSNGLQEDSLGLRWYRSPRYGVSMQLILSSLYRISIAKTDVQSSCPCCKLAMSLAPLPGLLALTRHVALHHLD